MVMIIILFAVDIDELTITPSVCNNGTIGKTFTLNCSVDLSPPEDVVSPVTFEWLYNTTNISLSTQTSIESNSSSITYISTLQFSPLRQSHAGMYTCHIEGNERLATSTVVKVKGKSSDIFTIK